MFEPVCHICDTKFSWYRDLTKHINERHGAQFRCAICLASFLTTWDYKNHIEEVEDGQYRCLWCEDVCYDISELQEHSLMFHDKPLQSVQSPIPKQSSGRPGSPQQRELPVIRKEEPQPSSRSSSLDADTSQKIQDIVSRISLPAGKRSNAGISSAKDSSMSAPEDGDHTVNEQSAWARPPKEAESSHRKISKATQGIEILSLNNVPRQMLPSASVADPVQFEGLKGGNTSRERPNLQIEAQRPSQLTESNLQQTLQDIKPSSSRDLELLWRSPYNHDDSMFTSKIHIDETQMPKQDYR